MSASPTLGIDLGGTNIKGAVVAADDRVLAMRSIATEASRGFEHVLGRMVALVEALLTETGLQRDQVGGVGVGVPGPMSHARGIIYSAPNLEGWVNIPLRDLLRSQTRMRTVLENDANAAAFGECVAGAARGAGDAVMLTLGTGIGAGVVLGGRLWRGAFDNAGEIGHTIIDPLGRSCPCGQRGCLERYASAQSIADRVKEALDAGEASSLRRRHQAGEALTAEEVSAAASAGDALCARIWADACRCLALACVNLQHTLNPRMIVLGGGLVGAGDRLLGPVRHEFDKLTWKIAPDQPQIVLATLEARAGVIGAACLAREADERS